MTERALKIKKGKCERLLGRVQRGKKQELLFYLTEDEMNVVIWLLRDFLTRAEEMGHDQSGAGV